MRPLSKHNQPILRAGIEAVAAMMDHFRKALELTTMKSEQIFLAKKIQELEDSRKIRRTETARQSHKRALAD